MNNLYDKVEELRQGTSTAVLFQRLEPARMSTWTTKLTPQDREIIAGEVASLFNLGSFAKAAGLKFVTDNYVSATEFEAIFKREIWKD